MSDFNQGEIVFVNFFIPGQNPKEHPCIIISNSLVQTEQDLLICLMITSSKVEDDFTFKITDEMLTCKLEKESQIRLHLLNTVSTYEVLKAGKIRPKLKHVYLEKLFKRFNEKILEISE